MPKKKVISCLLAIVAAVVAVLLLHERNFQKPSPEKHIAIKKESPVEPNANHLMPTEDLKPLTLTTKTREQVILPQSQPVQYQSFKDDGIQELMDQTTREVSRKAISLIKNPRHPGMAKLQEQMRQESTEETFLNLTDNLNIAMTIPVMAERPFTPGYYAADTKMVCKMTRVRKLLDEARKNPELISSFLQEQLSTIAQEFPSIYEEYMQLLNNDAETTKLTFKELPEVDKQRLLSTTAIYVLSEINAYDSLPIMARLSTQRIQRSSDFAGNSQVNPKFLLYSMHRLIKQFPEGQLSGEAQRARTKYLSIAERIGIPDPKKIKVPTWEAPYQEDDIRKVLPGTMFYAKDQPVIELTEYPPLNKLSRQKVEHLLKNAKAFVDVAFPG
jgi:hypothetical protein